MAVEDVTRLGRSWRALLVGVATVALATTMLAPGTAAADPDEPTTIAEAQALVEKLQTEAAALDQDWVAAQERLKEAERDLKATEADVSAQQTKVDTVREAVAQYALAQYQSRGVDTTTQLVATSDPQAMMRQLSVRDRVELTQRGILQEFQTETANLKDMQRSAEADVATVKASRADMSKARDASEAKVAEAKQVLDRLTEEERQRLAAEAERQRKAEAARAEAAAQSADENSANNSSADSDSADNNSASANSNSGDSDSKKSNTSAPAPVAASGVGGQVVAFAQAQVGASYARGGTGPSYDCSGLTSMAYKSAGRSIPRTSQAQFGGGKSVAKSDLQPGDLVFYYSGISHVGIYVGGGQIIHASRPGKPVGYAGVNSMPYMGARRY